MSNDASTALSRAVQRVSEATRGRAVLTGVKSRTSYWKRSGWSLDMTVTAVCDGVTLSIEGSASPEEGSEKALERAVDRLLVLVTGAA